MSDNALRNIETSRNRPEQLEWYRRRDAFIDATPWSGLEKFDAFPVFVSRQHVTRFIERYELYRHVLEIPGSIVECGVGNGSGLMAFAHFCSIFEPYHYVRKLIGFDTFEGFTEPSPQDSGSGATHMKRGGLCFDSYETLKESIRLYDENRILGHLPKVELVKGDLSKTLPAYIETQPALMVALLYLDVDLYRPTLDALTLLAPRMAKGSIIAFDELNHPDYPGETVAAMEACGLRNLRLRRLPIASMMSFAVVE